MSGEIFRPIEHALLGKQSALDNAIIDRQQELSLKIKVGGELLLYHGSQTFEPLRRGVAGDVAQVGGQLATFEIGIFEAS